MSTAFLRSTVVKGSIMLGAAWFFQSHWIAPLRLHEKESERKLHELRGRLDAAFVEFREIRKSEEAVGQARAALNEVLGDAPRESVMASFPERLRKHFANFGLKLEVLRLNAVSEQPTLSGYQRVYWSMALPVEESDRTITGPLFAATELEMQNRFIKVLDFSLLPDVENPERRVVAINLVALLPK